MGDVQLVLFDEAHQASLCPLVNRQEGSNVFLIVATSIGDVLARG